MAIDPKLFKMARKGPAVLVAQEVFVTLFSAADRVRAFCEKVMEQHGITGQQYNVLRILRGAGPEGLMTLTIADRMIERAPGITRMIDRLEAKGLVERKRCTDDRRCVHCRITPKGLALLKRLDAPVDQVTREAFFGLTRQEQEKLIELLTRVRASRELT